MNYLVGDIQGCAPALARLLDALAFSPSRDRLYVLGDLVNRGPASLATLRRLRDLGAAAICVLGARVARLDHHLQARLATRGERHLRHGEQRIQEDEEEQEGNVHARARRSGKASVAESIPVPTAISAPLSRLPAAPRLRRAGARAAA